VCKGYDKHLCRDAAHLHEKVLPEVVLGEFHVAVRALEVVDFVEKLLYVGATSLLRLPVTQGSLSKVHAPYLPLRYHKRSIEIEEEGSGVSDLAPRRHTYRAGRVPS